MCVCVRYARSLTAHVATSNGRKHAKQRLPHAESHPKPASTTHKHPQGQPFGPAQINLTFNFSSLAHSPTRSHSNVCSHFHALSLSLARSPPPRCHPLPLTFCAHCAFLYFGLLAILGAQATPAFVEPNNEQTTDEPAQQRVSE